MCAAFWDWLAKLPQGNASFVGSFTGASVGLIAILLGALFNAHLNRKRDDRLRERDRVAVASTLYAELQGIRDSLLERQQIGNAPPVSEGQVLWIPDLTIKLLPGVLPKLGLLPPETIRSVISAYALVERYLGILVLIGGNLQPTIPGGDRRSVKLHPSKAGFVAKLNQDTESSVEHALDSLLPYLN